MSKKERLIGEFEMNFKKSIFQWRSTLIKDDIISAYVNTRPGLKTGSSSSSSRDVVKSGSSSRDVRGQGRRAVQSFF